MLDAFLIKLFSPLLANSIGLCIVFDPYMLVATGSCIALQPDNYSRGILCFNIPMLEFFLSCIAITYLFSYCSQSIAVVLLFPGNFARSPYYRQSVEALRGHQLACRLLGEPLRFQTIRLGNQQNWVTNEEAHVRVLVATAQGWVWSLSLSTVILSIQVEKLFL